MTTQNWDQPLISVDVVPIRLNKANKSIEIFLGRRQYEPSKGEFALPGVLLSPHERVAEAAQRALNSKVSASESVVRLITDVGIADNPDRDPRGATLSIVNLAILGDEYAPQDEDITSIIVSDLADTKLPFDHNGLVAKALSQLDALLMNDKDASKALLGDTFRTTDLYSAFVELNKVTKSTSSVPDLSNLSRTLKNSPWLVAQVGLTSSTGKGRPSSQWAWN